MFSESYDQQLSDFDFQSVFSNVYPAYSSSKIYEFIPTVSQYAPQNGGDNRRMKLPLWNPQRSGKVDGESNKDNCCVRCHNANHKFTNFGFWVFIFNTFIIEIDK